MSKKILTISIAAYNVSSFIENTLNSLIGPQINKLEVIIENDGSTDATAEKVMKYVHKYPNTFILNNKKNGGYGSTINESVRLATGKYFKQLDGDDWFYKNNLEQYINLLEKIDVDCVYNSFFEYYENGKINEIGFKGVLETNKLYSIEDVMKYPNLLLKMHCLTYKTQILKDMNLHILEHCFYTDQEYVIYPMTRIKTVFVSDLSIYCYRLGLEGQSVSYTGIKKHYQDHYRVTKQILSYYEDILKCETATKQALINQLYYLISYQYIIYLIAGPSAKIKKELKDYDRYIKENFPNLYDFPKEYNGRNVKLLRKSKFLLYYLLSVYINL